MAEEKKTKVWIVEQWLSGKWRQHIKPPRPATYSDARAYAQKIEQYTAAKTRVNEIGVYTRPVWK